VKKETFYRPLGGGIEFHETGKVAVEREIQEELGLKIIVHKLVETFENIFEYEGKPGLESGKTISKAVWRSVDEIHSEGAKLYPADFSLE
jgi:ADP-ribose pyrophosphatase YjhB (NUDIX family)